MLTLWLLKLLLLKDGKKNRWWNWKKMSGSFQVYVGMLLSFFLLSMVPSFLLVLFPSVSPSLLLGHLTRSNSSILPLLNREHDWSSRGRQLSHQMSFSYFRLQFQWIQWIQRNPCTHWSEIHTDILINIITLLGFVNIPVDNLRILYFDISVKLIFHVS